MVFIFFFSPSFPKLRLFTSSSEKGRNTLRQPVFSPLHVYSFPSFQKSHGAQLSYICGMCNSSKQDGDEDCPVMQFSLGYLGCRKKRKASKHSCLMKFHGDRRVPAESLNRKTRRTLNPLIFLTKQSYRSETGRTPQLEPSSFVT